MTSTSFLKASAALLLAACAGTGHASCGASACSLMTDRYAQGADVHPGWSADLRLEALTQKRLRSGTVWINCHNVFDAALPFGGYKQSGWGREMGAEVFNNYLETKAVTTAL